MTQNATVLVVEDDPAIRMGLVDALGFEGYGVIQADSAPKGRDAALRDHCDCVLLDLMLPGGDGFTVLSEVRRVKPKLPIIILTARGREADRVRGLRLGADDYVVKPFSVRELLARVEAVLRRSPPQERDDTTVLAVPGGRADLARREVVFDDGERAELAEREVALLAYLAQNPERAVGRDELLEKILRVNPDHTQTRTVDMHVARLREKLRDDSGSPQVILTVRGKGYKFGASG